MVEQVAAVGDSLIVIGLAKKTSSRNIVPCKSLKALSGNSGNDDRAKNYCFCATTC
ncbi:uncharacterized protein G2W53_030603 [Senna tora]|uniref:Uncharacterized protein n=1 Tax=Senna tora TaxID=362788 RepID=A0A834WGX4_9FABA|nr:uncharacterized protein G2W53_030603 [Senna tora]